MSPDFIKKPQVIFIIVNWNQKKHLEECVTSVLKWISFPCRIIVADNGSDDGSVEMIKRIFPQVVLIANHENLGFGRANNRAFEWIEKNREPADFIILLNNDARLEDGSLVELLHFLQMDESVVAAAPALFLPDGSLQTGAGGSDLTLKTAFNYYFFLSFIFPRRFKGLFLNQRFFHKKGLITQIDWISGACFVLRKKAIDLNFRFPEDVFLYAEDLAFSRDLRTLGDLIYFPAAGILHHHLGSGVRSSRTLWLDSLFNYYRRKTAPKGIGPKRFFLKAIFFLGLGMRLIFYTLFSPAKNKEMRSNLRTYCRHIIRGPEHNKSR